MLGDYMKNYAIEFYRFVFSIVICTAHFIKRCDLYKGDLLDGGYMVGEFFFILCGFFMVKSHDSMIAASAKQETAVTPDSITSSSWAAKKSADSLLRRIKRLYPHYLFSFLVILIWEMWQRKNILGTLKNGFFEAFMLQRIGFDWELYNEPTWYICAMLAAGYFVMFFLLKNRNLFLYILAPAGIIAGYCCLYNRFGYMSGIATVIGCIPAGLIRAGADILVGCIAYELYLKISPLFKDRFHFTASGFEILLYGVLLWYMFCAGHTRDDFIIIVIMAAAILCTYMGNSSLSHILNNKLSRQLGTLSYGIYLNHWLLIQVFLKFPALNQIAFHSQLMLYLGSVILYSILTTKIVQVLSRRISL